MDEHSAVNWDTLRAGALAARHHAHAPYSQFAVGAALLTLNEEVVYGVNVENASFGLTQCAERSAICAAVSQGQKRFCALAVAADSDRITAPCGACLQVMAEFVDADFPILLVNARDGEERRTTFGELLPSANQGLENLANG